MKIGYGRVSTSGQNTDRQLDMLSEAGCERIFIDKMTGITLERPELQRMLDMLRLGDVVIVTEQARLGRSLRDLFSLFDKFKEIGVDFISLKEKGIDTTTPYGKFFYAITGAWGQLEVDIKRTLIVEGIQAARARGRIGGRPGIDYKKIELIQKLYKSKKYSISEIKSMTGVSNGTIYKYVNKMK